MTASIIQIEMKRGDVKRLNPVTIETREGLPVNLTGFEVRWHLYRTNSINPILTKSSNDVDTANGVLITDREKGVLRITIASEDTKTLEQGRYYHDIQIVDVDNQASTVASGILILVNKM